jgi:hypothetical protein
LPYSVIRKFILILADIIMKGKAEGKSRSENQACSFLHRLSSVSKT